jgi:RNA polymerase primary sigma factor
MAITSNLKRSRPESMLMVRMLMARPVTEQAAIPANLPAQQAHLWCAPLLNREEEIQHFQELERLRAVVVDLRAQLHTCRGCMAMHASIDKAAEELTQRRNAIVEANLRLVVAIAKPFMVNSQVSMDELLSVGNTALIAAVEQFKYRLGFRFSTYAFKAIRRAILASLKVENRRRTRFVQDVAALTDLMRDDATPLQAEVAAREAGVEATRLLKLLNTREQIIVRTRFGMDPNSKPCSFQKIGDALGLSKQRVGTIFAKAMEKMRKATLQEQASFIATLAAGMKPAGTA